MKNLLWNNIDLRDNYPNVSYYLNQYYPIGISKNDKRYADYSGMKCLSDLIERNILNPENFNKTWQKGFLNELSNEISFDVTGATYGLAPNFGGKILLDESEDLSRSTELLFFVSLLTNYFSIQIVEKNKFNVYEHNILGKKTGWGIDRIFVSPVQNDYLEMFKKVESFIFNKLQDSKFLPFIFDKIRIKKFEVPYKEEKDCSVSSGFFNKGFSIKENSEIIGDVKYRINELD